MLFLFCFLWGEGWGSQQCSPGLSWTHCVGQIGFKLTVFQTHPSECWDWPQGSATMPSSHYFVHLFFKIKCIGITFFPVCNFFILSAYIFDSLTESRIFFGNFISFVFLHLRDLKAFWFSVLCNIFFSLFLFYESSVMSLNLFSGRTWWPSPIWQFISSTCTVLVDLIIDGFPLFSVCSCWSPCLEVGSFFIFRSFLNLTFQFLWWVLTPVFFL